MGQKQEKPERLFKGFPKVFTKYPPSPHCRGPGLVEELDAKTRDILPKCFEGAHLKIRKKLSKHLNVGYNMIFSTVTPSGGQVASDYKSKETNLEFSLAPSGAIAVHTKVQLSSRFSFNVDSQSLWGKRRVGTMSIIYSYRDTTAAVSTSACAVPFNVQHHEAEDFEKIDDIKNFMTLSLQCVQKITPSYVFGVQWNVGRCVRLAGTLDMRKGKFGVIVDPIQFQAFWWRDMGGRLAVGGAFGSRWNGTEAVASLGGSWHCPGTIVKASICTDGLVACTLKKTLFQGEQCHFALLLSGLLNQMNNKFRLGVGFEGYF